ncbi:unnamed protein product [Urochloa decumbens]
MDSGNLVMRDQGGNILWQSFDHPTDTLLPTQPVTATAKLVSTDLSRPSSYYTLRFDDRYILSLAYDGPEISNLYWPNPDFSSWLNYRISYNRSRRGVLDNLGQFIASDNTSFVSSDWGPGIKRRLTLDYDGNLRLYSLNDSSGSWSVSWMAFSQPCEIHGICGWNGVCVYTPAAACFCPPGYVVRDPSDWSKGCKPTFNISCRGSDQQMGFVSLPQTDFWGSDLDYIPMTSLDACRIQCLNSCSCLAFEYKLDSNDCYLKSVLLNGKTVPGYPGTAHLKVPQNLLSKTISYVHENSEILDCNSSNTKVEVLSFDSDAHGNGGKATTWHYYYGFLAAFFLIEVCFIAFGWWFIVKKQSTQSEIWAAEEGYRMVTDHFRSFTYKELREATKNFKDQLGHGRYGSVYKGILRDKRIVAVKKLGDVKQGEDEFQTEVSVIGRIYHMNLVRVWGVCSERKHRLLVFEYVDNGSLAMFLFGNQGLLQWDQRYKIAVGVGKGLAYLHHECLDWIIHCDVKPENILLDHDFDPKISDFGVAKLLQRDHRTDPNMSKVHGTRGYAAPEWASNIPINEKVDVYSYGVVLLELVSGRRAFELAASGTGDAEIAMRQLVWTIKEKLKSGDWSWITGFVDPRLNGNIVHSEVCLMLEVAAMCMEKERSQRPSMNDIVEKFSSFPVNE